MHTKQMQRENAAMIKMIANIEREGGRVSTRWDELFIAGWYEHWPSATILSI